MFAVSCQKEKKQEKQVTINTSKEKYFNAKDAVIIFDSIPEVTIFQKDSIANWKGYFRVKKSLEKIKRTTPNEILVVSKDLVKEIKVMRDSISVISLRERGMRARINALYNQSLRLQEMKNIPAITVPKIVKQAKGLFSIFRMINHKINAIYEQKNFEKELIEDEFFFSKIDSIQ